MTLNITGDSRHAYLILNTFLMLQNDFIRMIILIYACLIDFRLKIIYLNTL